MYFIIKVIILKITFYTLLIFNISNVLISSTRYIENIYMKKSSFLLYNYSTSFFFLIKLKVRIKIKNVKKKPINDILKIFYRSVFVLNTKFK